MADLNLAIALSLQAGAVAPGLQKVAGSLTTVEQAATKASPALDKAAVSATKGESAFTGMAHALGTFTLAAYGVRLVADAIGGFLDDAVNSQQVATQLNAVLTSTRGVSGETARSVTDLSNSLSLLTRYDDEAITSAQSMLLTFTNIGRSVFPQATEATLNMSEALHQGLQESAIQLGKALQDPVAGVTALQRVGVRLTDTQKELVSSLVAAGDTMGAQRVILAELETEFGGAARAAGTTFAGQLAILNTQVGNLKEDIGGPLIGVLSSLVTTINTEVIPSIRASGEAIDRDADIISLAHAKISAAQERTSTTSSAVKSAADETAGAIERMAAQSLEAAIVNDTWVGSLVRLHQNLGEFGNLIGYTDPKVQHLSDTLAAVRENGMAGGAMFVTVRPQVAHLGDTMAAVAGDAAELANKLIADQIALVAFNDQVAAMRKAAGEEMARDPNAGRPLEGTDPSSRAREAAVSQGLLQSNLAATEAAALKASRAVGSSGFSSGLALAGDATSALNAQLQKLQATLTDLSHPHLLGMGADADKIFALEEKVKKAQLRIDRAELGGVRGAGLASLQKQESNLQKQLDIARLKDELKFDSPLRAIAKAAAGPITEISAADALAGVTKARAAYDLLVPQVDASRDSLRGLKLAADEAKAALKALSQGRGAAIAGGAPIVTAQAVARALGSGAGSQLAYQNTSAKYAPGTLP